LSFYLGIDGGGTKTEAALIDETGRLVAESLGKASNPLRSSFAHAFTAIDDAAARALAAARIEAMDVRGVAAGLAGAGQPRVAKRVAAFLGTRFRDAEIEALTDLEIALEAIAAEGAAVVVAAGTGSAAFGRDGAGHTARAGGWGPWFSDEGSAFDIGRRALAAMARAHDASTPPGSFEQAVAASLGADNWEQVVYHVCRRPLDRLPKVFPAVAAAADAGSEAAREVLDQSVENLARLAGLVIGRLELDGKEFALGRVGGIFGRSTYLDRRIEERFAGLAPGARLRAAQYSPAMAAAQRALRRAAARGERE
jgi:N-acetylglucosamine kinase-like BadF-type ATPase